MEKDQTKGAGAQGRSLRDRLGQWESRLAPLSDKQKDGFMELSSAATFRPLPPEVSHFAHVQYLFVVSFPFHSQILSPSQLWRKIDFSQRMVLKPG